jgi:hypothetical protein
VKQTYFDRNFYLHKVLLERDVTTTALMMMVVVMIMMVGRRSGSESLRIKVIHKMLGAWEFY